MGEITAKTKSPAGALVRRRRTAVAAFRRERRGGGYQDGDEARAIPDWGRIVLRSGSITLR
jgi:hypothetical protein